ncbi:MAG: hypothetical protein IJ173_06205 [Kiritimatiellae bacterium]|nr:hypothetical protein [Kiritimatiellia bacterium]
MQNETVSTPPSQGGVFCSPPLARAGARFNTVPIQVRRVLNGDIEISSLDRARTREIEAAVNDADIVAVAERPTARLVAGNPRRGGDGALPSRECLRARRLCTSPQPELAEDRVEETDFLQKAKKGENSFEHCKHWTKTTLRGRRGV